MKLFIDDERWAPAGYNRIARTSVEAIKILEEARDDGRQKLELVSFDYDAHQYLALTFFEVAEWMAENDVWPEEIRIHTASPYGRVEYEKFFARHAPETTKVDLTDPFDIDAVLKDEPAWVDEFYEAQNR